MPDGRAPLTVDRRRTLDQWRSRASRGARDALRELSWSPVHPDDTYDPVKARDLYSSNGIRRGRARFEGAWGTEREIRTIRALRSELGEARWLAGRDQLHAYDIPGLARVQRLLTYLLTLASGHLLTLLRLAVHRARHTLHSTERGTALPGTESPPEVVPQLVSTLLLAPGAPSFARLTTA